MKIQSYNLRNLEFLKFEICLKIENWNLKIILYVQSC